MKTKDATKEELKALYQAAKEFRLIHPWKWVEETDIFGVQNPSNGEIGYCCIMGELGEVLGMAVYLGAEGLQGYKDIIQERIKPEDPDMMFIQNCIFVSFEDNAFLEKQDMSIIKKTGLKFRDGRNTPIFRRHEPGYFPWTLNREEVQFMTSVLQQAKEVCQCLKKNDGLLVSPKKNSYLVRVQDCTTGGWKDAWLKPASPEKKVLASAVVDDLRLQRIKKNIRSSATVWEMEFFYSLTPVDTGARPYFPYAMMIADHDTGFIHDIQLSDRLTWPSEFPGHIMACLESSAALPSEVLASKEEVVELLKPITKRLGIALRKVNKLPAIDEARKSMGEYLQSDASPDPEYCGDEVLEELLEEAGSELSLCGLYGLLYGCHAAPNIVMPSHFIPLIFGEEGAQFETNEEAEETMGNIMALWNIIGQWDPETEALLIPEYDYPQDAEGTRYRIFDNLALVAYFYKGLELGGITFEELLLGDMKEYAGTLAMTTKLLHGYLETLKNEKPPRLQDIKKVMKAIETHEAVIDGCIANIHIGLKELK